MTVYRRKDTGAWMVHLDLPAPTIADPNRRVRIRKTSPVNTKAGALEYERELRAAAPEALRKGKVTFARFVPEYLAYSSTNNRASTMREKVAAFERLLVPFFGPMLLHEIGKLQLEQYKAHRAAAGRHPKTINNEAAHVVALLRYAVECGLLEKAPRLKAMKLPPAEFDFLTFDEAERLLVAARTGPDKEPWGTMILVALRTGMRRGELRGLRWTDVDLAAGRLVVKVAADDQGVLTPPKSGRSREIPLSSEAVDALTWLRSSPYSGPLKSEHVFCRPDGKMWTQRQMENPLQYVCKRAGLRSIGWHGLRHTFASHLVMRGVVLQAVQELLGHATVAMTLRYAHLSPDVRRDAVQLLDRPREGSLRGRKDGTR
jgi:integrase